MVSRDLDSRLNQREASAVQDWLVDEHAAFHFMLFEEQRILLFFE